MTTKEANSINRSKYVFNQVFESYRHLLKEDLARFAYRRQKMVSEMKLFSAKGEYIEEHLEMEFTEMVDEILKELEEKPIAKSRGVGWLKMEEGTAI